jgi:signal transduction histidine kinase
MGYEKRILVIDDEERMADSIKALLTNYDYDVLVAYDGNQGIEMLKESDVQVVITDIRMPEADGYEIMRYVQDKLPHVLVVVITGHASTESVIEALHNKCFDYLQKPFDFEKLKACVDRAFNKIEQDRMREDMISMITHDIKIPLTSIVGFSASVFNKEGQLSDRGGDYVRMIQMSAEKIRSLIDNFLTTCKIEAGKLQLLQQPVNLQFVLEDLLQVMKYEMDRNDQTLETNWNADGPMIMGDEHLLERALGNIINNAIKYTPQGGTITITTERMSDKSSPLKKGSVRVSVSNSGPGIPGEQLDDIFDKYQRTSNITGIEGSGIGLYVVKFIAEQHQGVVAVESSPGEQTTFHLTFPLHTS